MVDRLSWGSIALMLTAPPFAGTLLALFGWRKKEFILGNLAGTAVIFGSAMALILRESVALDCAVSH